MRVALITAFLTSFAAFSHAADWPCWRGPDGLGVSAEKNLPTRWSKSTNIAWHLEIPGKGASSPTVVGDRLYLTTQTKETALRVLAIDAKNGKLLWDREVAQGKQHANNIHNMATPTPVADASHVWARFGTGDFACLDRDGNIVWHRALGQEFGHYKANHGMGTSPMLLDGRLFIAVMHQGPSFLLALDAATGKDVWKKDRNLNAKEEANDSYSSPIILRPRGRPQIVLAGAESVTGHDPATGETLWSHGGMNVAHSFGRTIAGPTAADDTVIAVASGFQNRGYTVAVNASGKGKVKNRLWTLEKFSPDCPTPVIYEGRVYCVRDDGNVSCLDLKTGQTRWQERPFSENVKVSPVAADGKVYFTTGQGNCYVVRAGDKFELLARNELAEATLASPAISGGKIFLRTESRLYCFAQ